MELGIKGKLALVTASSKGFGLATAKALAQEGARVCISSRRADNVTAAMENLIRDTGAEVSGYPCDMRLPTSITQLCGWVRSELGAPDILVNNTGGPKPGGFFDLTESDWEEGHRLLMLSTVVLYKELLPSMRERGWGRVVNITSTTSRQPIANLILSNAFRPGILGLAKTVADEVARDGVLINTVMPGIHMTDRMRELSGQGGEGSGEGSIVERLTKQVPLGRAGQPEELAAMVTFLCSEKASNITGSAFAVDGGSIRCI